VDNYYSYALTILLAIITGIGLSLPFYRSFFKKQQEQHQMELQVQEQNWSQRWEDKEKQLQESRNIHLALEAEIQSLRLELSEQQQARAAAEEKNSWLNYLEEQLQRQKKELVHMQEENGRLQVLAAELKANLEEEKIVWAVFDRQHGIGNGIWGLPAKIVWAVFDRQHGIGNGIWVLLARTVGAVFDRQPCLLRYFGEWADGRPQAPIWVDTVAGGLVDQVNKLIWWCQAP
jgi:hypothetical protein